MPDDKVVAIHQPNFFPWLGYFNKLANADVFVILDNVQFPKTGGTWMNRVRLLVNGNPQWVTMPVVRAYTGLRSINDMMIRENGWRAELLRTLEHSYKRAACFDAVYPVLTDLIGNPAASVAEYNLAAMSALSQRVGLGKAELVCSSTLAATGKATDLLIGIVKAVGGSTYLCGGGAAGYQEDDQFSAEGIRLVYQNFQHPGYRQIGVQAFIPGLSIIDTLMNCGFDETRRLVMNSWPSHLNAKASA